MAGFCKTCGTALADNAKFCTTCGTATVEEAGAPAEPDAPKTVESAAAAPVQAAPVQAAPVPPQPAPQQPAYQQPYQQAYPQPPKSNTGLIAALVGALVLIAALGTYLIMSRGDDSSAATGNDTGAVVGASGEAISNGVAATGAPAQAYSGPEAGAAVGPEVVKYITSDANIRNIATAQSNGSRVTGTLKRGAQVRGVMHQGLSGAHHWLKLSDGRGYVSAINLGDGPPSAVAAAPATQGRAPVANATYCQVVTKTGNLRIRSGPNGRIIGGMPPGARFQAYGGEYDNAGTYWVQVQPVELRYPVGWVSGDHVAC